MNLAALKSAQEAAGGRYAAAAAEYAAALVDLAALDETLMNVNVNPHADRADIRTFARIPGRHEIEHPTFFQPDGVRRFREQIEEARDAYISQFNA